MDIKILVTAQSPILLSLFGLDSLDLDFGLGLGLVNNKTSSHFS